MIFKTGQVEWPVPQKALDESMEQLIVLFIFWPFQWKLTEHTCTCSTPTCFVMIYWILTVGRRPEKLQSSAVYATEQLQRSSCWEASRQRLMREDSAFLILFQRCQRTEIQLIKATSRWHLTSWMETLSVWVFDKKIMTKGKLSKKERKKERTLNNKQEPIKCSIRPSAPQVYSGWRRPLFTESVYHARVLLSTGEMLHVSQ